MSDNAEPRKIPFIKPARIGNYKIWRTKATVGSGKDKMQVEQICVSDLDGLWQVRVPATFEVFGMISELYSDEKMIGALSVLVANMLAVTSVTNGYFHRAVQMCASAYFNPDLLRDKKQRKAFSKEAELLIKAFLGWRELVERRMQEDAPTEEEERNDAVLEELLGETAEE